MDESRRSFAGYLEAPVTGVRLDDLFRRIEEGTEWRRPDGLLGQMPRKTAWMVRQGCECPYRYGGIEVKPQAFPVWMLDIMEIYMPFCGLSDRSSWPDSCNLNLYETGEQSVGWHADDEALFQGTFHDIRILSLSLGQQRKFELRKSWPDGDEKTTYKMLLGNGALCTMEGMVQKHFLHRVPKQDNVSRPRINLTWRWIRKHSQKCPVGH